jgi:hypothetical protein
MLVCHHCRHYTMFQREPKEHRRNAHHWSTAQSLTSSDCKSDEHGPLERNTSHKLLCIILNLLNAVLDITRFDENLLKLWKKWHLPMQSVIPFKATPTAMEVVYGPLERTQSHNRQARNQFAQYGSRSLLIWWNSLIK